MKAMEYHETLAKRYDEIRNELDEAENSLKKLLGKKRDFSSLSPDYRKDSNISSRKVFFHERCARQFEEHFQSTNSNASDEELPPKKIALRSAVVTNVKGLKSRRDVIHRQNCNNIIQSRNRRILGMVQSTLQKFKDEAVRRQSQDLKRIKIEQKLEAAEQQERQLVEKQKAELYLKQNEKQLELHCLEKMMALTKSFAVWENDQTNLLNYILTKAEPRIYFLPASHTSNSKKCLEESRIKIQDIVQKQKEAFEKELAEVKKSYHVATPNSKIGNSYLQDDSNNALEWVTQSIKQKRNYGKSLCLSEDELLFSE